MIPSATEEKAAEEQLKVIGAGFGRTATESLQKALIILGYKCYHMHEIFKNKHHTFHIQ